MMIQVQNQLIYRLLQGCYFQKQFFFYRFLTNQANSYQMSSQTNFYQMFLDQSDLIESHLNI